MIHNGHHRSKTKLYIYVLLIIVGAFTLFTLFNGFKFAHKDVNANSESEDPTPASILSDQEFSEATPKKPRKVLITGASGFIGFHLSIRLQEEEGAKVLGLDNYNHYYPVELKRVRTSILKQKYGIEIVDGDVCDEPLLQKIFDEFQPTHIIHLAAQPGVKLSLKEPERYVHNNVICYVRLLEHIRTYNPNTILLSTSSSSVYGNNIMSKNGPDVDESSVSLENSDIRLSEKDTIQEPMSVYGASKGMGELLSHTYYHLYKIPVANMRLFTVYGPYGRPDMALFQWIQKILKNQEIVEYQTANNEPLYRDFTYVQDIVSGYIGTMKYLETAKRKYATFNLGSSSPQPVSNLRIELERWLKKKTTVKLQLAPKTEVLKTYADLEHSKKSFGFQPKTKLSQGIKDFVDWYKDMYHPNTVVATCYFTLREDSQVKGKFFANNNFTLIEGWYNSVSAAGLRGIIFHDNLSEQFVNQYTSYNIRFVNVKDWIGKRSNNDERYFVYLRYITERAANFPNEPDDWKLEYMLMTDLFDCKILKNPFELMKEKDQGKHLIYIGSEGDDLNNKWLQWRLESCQMTELFKKAKIPEGNRVLNAGILGGHVSVVKEFLQHLTQHLTKDAPVEQNCNMPMFNYVTYRYFADRHFTGSPLHTQFYWKEVDSKKHYIQHK